MLEILSVEGWAIKPQVTHYACGDVAPDAADGDGVNRGDVVEQRGVVDDVRSRVHQHPRPGEFLRRELDITVECVKNVVVVPRLSGALERSRLVPVGGVRSDPCITVVSRPYHPCLWHPWKQWPESDHPCLWHPW